MNKIILTLTAAALTLAAMAQEKQTFTGKVVGTDGQPLEGVILSLPGATGSAITNEKGEYVLETTATRGTLKVTFSDYYTHEYPLKENLIPKVIVLVPTAERNYSDQAQTHYKKDFSDSPSADLSWQGVDPALNIVGKGGMPGEGGYLNIRGLNSFNGENTPLLVINGVPFLANLSVSEVINAYSRDALFGYNAHDIRSIKVLKGAEAAMYGSLGSNGVIEIQTEQATSDNLDTKISFQGSYGMQVAKDQIPTLNANQYKNYLMSLGQTRYSSLSALQTDYPFLSSNPGYYGYLFGSNTDWTDKIYNNGFVTDNVLRVEGGDEVAKYNISFGYTRNNGVLTNTQTSRYHTALNTNIMVSRQFDIFAGVNLAYVNSDLNNTGMSEETNPILAAYHMMPNLNEHEQLSDGSVIKGRYLKYNGWNVNANPTYSYDNVSNPSAIVNTVDGTDKIYDANINLGLNYRMTPNWTFTGQVNLYYDYTEEYLFVPGVTDKAILPQLYGTGKNYVSMGVIRQQAYFYNLHAAYRNTWNQVHNLSAYAGVRLLTKNFELDASRGYNSANDYYKTLSKVTDEWGIFGNNDEWKWLSFYTHADYTYDNWLKLDMGVTADASSASGVDASRFGWFPSASLTYLAANQLQLPDAFDRLNVIAEASISGNSRFSSNYAKNYYTSNNLFNFGTIVRHGVPNTKLEWEKKAQVDLGVDVGLLGNKINVQVSGFAAKHYDLLLDANISAVYGSNEKYFTNSGEVTDAGVELSLRYNPIHNRDWDWVIYANGSYLRSEVTSLGNQDRIVTDYTAFNNDDAQTLLKKGKSPYEFYGYRTKGVFATTAEAEASGLKSTYGHSYQGGDVIFVDQDNNGIINDNDRVSLGSAVPDWFGSFGTSLRWRQWLLSADFSFSIGNKAYNAVRRQTESMDRFYNQSTSVLSRWQKEGDQTHMPRAAYGDPSGNNFFSDRWVEDASYLKLRDVRLSYDFTKRQVRFASGTIWLGAENLFTVTKYLGADPEFSYCYSEALRGFDYAKVSNPVTYKVGVSLNF
ncbi:MAG: SusC/RagA family TonB-linked outer membrane protein [Bacteroidales bacterium]|nr:SusC/RagA family TonB-linked outer membrane protein [Bacteroidales bacterium]